MARWVKDDTLMVAKPFTRFDDQGFLGWIALRLNLNIYKTQNFTMEVPWKDVKYYGEGIAYCEGKFTNMQNYYFSKIRIKVNSPRPEEFVILDSKTIDI